MTQSGCRETAHGGPQSQQTEGPRVPFLPPSEASFGATRQKVTPDYYKKNPTLPDEMKVTPKWVYAYLKTSPCKDRKG